MDGIRYKYTMFPVPVSLLSTIILQANQDSISHSKS